MPNLFTPKAIASLNKVGGMNAALRLSLEKTNAQLAADKAKRLAQEAAQRKSAADKAAMEKSKTALAKAITTASTVEHVGGRPSAMQLGVTRDTRSIAEKMSADLADLRKTLTPAR